MTAPGPRLRLLFLGVGAQSAGQATLDPAEGYDVIEKAIAPALARGDVALSSHWKVRVPDLQGYVTAPPRPNVVHVHGHGTSTGKLVLAWGGDETVAVKPGPLAKILAGAGAGLRLVFFNACYSAELAEAAVAAADFAVGMKGEIEEKAAIALADAFYRAVGLGSSVRAAFDAALAVVDALGLGEQDTPALFERTPGTAATTVLLPDHRPPPPRWMLGTVALLACVPAVAVLRYEQAKPSSHTGPRGGEVPSASAAPDVPIARFGEGARGIVLGGAWLSTAEGKDLCTRTERFHPRRADGVRCVPASGPGIAGGLVKKAREAGATVVAEIDAAGLARVSRIGEPVIPLLVGPYTMDLKLAVDRDRAPELLAAMALAPSVPPHLARCPAFEEEPLDIVGLLTLVAVPDCAAGAKVKLEYLDEDVCSGATAKPTPECALGRYLRGQQETDPAAAEAVWKGLADRAPAPFSSLASVELLRLHCEDSPAEVARTLVAIDAASDPYARPLLTEIAACVRASLPAADVDARVAEIEARPIPAAPLGPDFQAGSLAVRAHWRGKAGRWADAVKDYEAAYAAVPDPIYSMSKAECLLHEGEVEKARDVLREISRKALPRDQRFYAAQLDWTAARRAKDATAGKDAAATILDLYDRQVADQERAIVKDDQLHAIECARIPEGRCPYDALLRPKSAGARADLAKSLAAD